MCYQVVEYTSRPSNCPPAKWNMHGAFCLKVPTSCLCLSIARTITRLMYIDVHPCQTEKRRVEDRGNAVSGSAARRSSTPRTEPRPISRSQPTGRTTPHSSRDRPTSSTPPPKPTPSSLLTKLSQLNGASQKQAIPTEVLERSTAFNARPA